MAAKGADLAVKGGVLVDGKEMRRGDIFIKDGLVDGIERSESTRSAQSVIDATGKFVLPGIIEAHCHPVYADRFDTFSQSAAYGGITTIIPYIGVVKSWGKTGNLLNTVKEFKGQSGDGVGMFFIEVTGKSKLHNAALSHRHLGNHVGKLAL